VCVRVRGMEFPPKSWTFQATQNRVVDDELAIVGHQPHLGWNLSHLYFSFMRGHLQARWIEPPSLFNVEIEVKRGVASGTKPG